MSLDNPPRAASMRFLRALTGKGLRKSRPCGFVIPYLHNGQMHDYIPDFIIRLKASGGEGHHYLILETKGFDPLDEVKREAAARWANAVNADGMYGHWQYDIARKPAEVTQKIDKALAGILD